MEQMTNEELIAALRYCPSHGCGRCIALDANGICTGHGIVGIMDSAADLIEAQSKRIEELEVETERLKASNEELRERQTYIDHWGNKWMTSGKDVPTAAYNHGFLDGEKSCNCGSRMRKGEQE